MDCPGKLREFYSGKRRVQVIQISIFLKNTRRSHSEQGNTVYYSGKVEILQDIFGAADVVLNKKHIVVKRHPCPVIEDVIILLDPAQYPPSIRKFLNSQEVVSSQDASDFAEDIQFTFGTEWLSYPDILPEHEEEFALYFDLVDLADLQNLRVCDLGCGIGR